MEVLQYFSENLEEKRPWVRGLIYPTVPTHLKVIVVLCASHRYEEKTQNC